MSRCDISSTFENDEFQFIVTFLSYHRQIANTLLLKMAFNQEHPIINWSLVTFYKC